MLQPINGFNSVCSLFKRENFDNQRTNFDDKKTVAFCSSTSAGQPLRKMKNVPCPYFGIKMISSSDINNIFEDLVSCTTVKKTVKYLKKFAPNMQKTERAIFDRFDEAAEYSPRMKFPDLLKQWYDVALVKLKLEEFNVIDDIDDIASRLSPETNLEVREKTTNCRYYIIDNNPDRRFKRKNALDLLNNIRVKSGEEKLFTTLLDRANYLPTSATSENAFIIKYADRSHYEIAKRLVSASVATIEHVLPESKGGDNDMANFLLASANANNLRNNMPLKKFIKMFPQVPENCQKYIDFIIERMNEGELKMYPTYPYDIKQTLVKQSNNKIKLDVSGYKLSKSEAKAIDRQLYASNAKHKFSM